MLLKDLIAIKVSYATVLGDLELANNTLAKLKRVSSKCSRPPAVLKSNMARTTKDTSIRTSTTAPRSTAAMTTEAEKNRRATGLTVGPHKLFKTATTNLLKIFD